ncbi:7592_t:CDS:1, partial [Funneliformis mosseae]
ESVLVTFISPVIFDWTRTISPVTGNYKSNGPVLSSPVSRST